MHARTYVRTHIHTHTHAPTHTYTNTNILHENGFKKPGTYLVQQLSCDLKYTQYTGIIIPNTGYVPNM